MCSQCALGVYCGLMQRGQVKAYFNGDTGSGGDATGEEGVRDGAQLGSNDGTPRPAYVGTGTHAAECGGMTEEGHGA